MVMYNNEIETKRKKKTRNKKIYNFTFSLVEKDSRLALAPQTRLSAPNKVCYVGSMILNDNDDHDGNNNNNNNTSFLEGR